MVVEIRPCHLVIPLVCVFYEVYQLADYRTGPPAVPFFGNELQIPKSDAHFQYADFF